MKTIADYLYPSEYERYAAALDAGNVERMLKCFHELGEGRTERLDPAILFPEMGLAAQQNHFVTAAGRYGGGFVRRLADAYVKADGDNKRKIRETWPEYWAKYIVYGRDLIDHTPDPT